MGAIILGTNKKQLKIMFKKHISLLFIVPLLTIFISCTQSQPQEGDTSNIEYLDQELRDSMTPEEILQVFKDGNDRFLSGNLQVRKFTTELSATYRAQHPYAVVLSCIDSRVPVETIFDRRFGEVFSTRLAGNVVNEDAIGGMEFSVNFAGAKLIIVMGHTSCGAVKGAINNVEYGNLTSLVNKIKPAVEQTNEDIQTVLDPSSSTYIDLVGRNNVDLAIKQIRERSPELAEMEQNGDIKIVGAMYDITTGEVIFYE